MKEIMQQIKFKKLHEDAKIPKRAHDSDEGFDLVAISIEIKEDEETESPFIEYNTGLSIEFPEGYYGEIHPRSSISKYDLLLANSVAVIDSGYRGPIKLRFKILAQYFPNIYKPGDKIAQLLIKKSCNQFEFIETEGAFSSTDRGEGGFGSTGQVGAIINNPKILECEM